MTTETGVSNAIP